MAVLYFVLVIISFTSHRSLAQRGDPFVYFPPFELRAVSGDNSPFIVSNKQFQSMGSGRQLNEPQQSMVDPQQRVFHTSQHIPPAVNEEPNELPIITTTEKPHEDTNSTIGVHDLLHALGLDESGHEVKDHSRAAARDYDYPPGPSYPSYAPYPPPHPPSYGYGYPPRPSYQPSYPPRPSYPPSYGPSYPPPPQYHEPPYAYVPPTHAHVSPHPKSFVKPLLGKLDLVKPVATKVASKVSGLIGLVLALLTGSSFDGGELTGFKDIVINGIVKPLLIAKGGIKSLISKLAIPVIALLLINLEFLITVWWLWEDCPEHVHVVQPAYPYPKPAYNSYR